MLAAPRALHLTFHRGCGAEMDYICENLGIDLDTWYLLDQKPAFLDGVSKPSQNYLMDHARAERIFLRHKETFEKYDLIITSDIAPLSRIFLQNNWEKPLIVWVCNRFDMNVSGSSFFFPDEEYLALFEQAKHLDHVQMIGYCKYEAVHAKSHRGITSIEKTIEPTGNGRNLDEYKSVPKKIDKKNTFFLRKYKNERKFSLHQKLKAIGIHSYIGPYAGSPDLKDFKGMIHIPLVMGNFHLWENLKEGVIHFIPTKRFYKGLYSQKEIEFWDWTNAKSRNAHISTDEIFENCDWYDSRLAPLFVFFDSLEELQELTQQTDYQTKKALIKEFHKKHTKESLDSWKEVFAKALS
ncbi:MAG: hypothetical protein SP4CHLAM5_07800 [Chlamydiia bacterium]|nr:hypothetical protein [Chlamydiia bacterium]MCH9618644.1 hypothetical protein [Chlamydiia bacterium]